MQTAQSGVKQCALHLLHLLSELVILQGQFINDRQVLLKAAKEASISGAEELLDDEDELKPEVSPTQVAYKHSCYWADVHLVNRYSDNLLSHH